MQYFLVDSDIRGGHAIISEPETIHQIKTVLRSNVGDECVLIDGKGLKAKAIIENFDKRSVIMKLSEHEKIEEKKFKIRLYIAISKKPATFELILQKATELGVDEIIPLVTDRCQAREIRNQKRLLYIIKEATEQCERVFLPKLHDALKWKDFFGNKPDGVILTGDARMYDFKLMEFKPKKNEDINLVIGPEGGLTDKELLEVREMGGKIFILGKNVLRMETAAIASMTVIYLL